MKHKTLENQHLNAHIVVHFDGTKNDLKHLKDKVIQIFIYAVEKKSLDFHQYKHHLSFWENYLIMKVDVDVDDPRELILYRRLYWFGQRYDIFRIPVNTGVPF